MIFVNFKFMYWYKLMFWMNIATQGVLLFAEIVPTKLPIQGIIN